MIIFTINFHNKIPTWNSEKLGWKNFVQIDFNWYKPKWSLAETAAVHAKRCQFAHSTSDQLFHPIWHHQIGENLAVFRGPKTFVNDLFVWIVDGFYEERKYYDYETRKVLLKRDI